MPPFGLDDETLSQRTTAAAPLPPECRAEFMQAVTDAIAGIEPGPGVLYRKIAELQRQYLSRASGLDTAPTSARSRRPTPDPMLARDLE
jgi:hypothetical protein